MHKVNFIKITLLIGIVVALSVLCLMLWQMNRSFEPQSGARFISIFGGNVL
ncbi:MAG: hypothetical protein GX802_07010 [Clostridiales bacterium]|nr:hypothetical protein [Clostridiales bacterium]